MTAKPRSDLLLDQVARNLTPELWQLRVRSTDGQLDETLPWPEDGRWRDELAEHFGVGQYEVKLTQRPGRNTREERGRLGVPTKPSWELVELREAARPRVAPPLTTASEPAAPIAFEHANVDDDEAVQRELRETARIEAECARVEAEAKLRRLKAGLDPTAPASDGGAADVVRQLGEMMREQARTAAEREARLMQELARRASPEPTAGLMGLRESLGLVREVLGMTEAFRAERAAEVGGDGEASGAAGSIVQVLREARGLLGAWPRPVALPTSPRAAAVPGLPAPPAGEQRVRSFVETLVNELTIGSDPETVAEQLEANVGLLPEPIRRQLDAGSWRGAWQEIARYVDADEWSAVDGMLAASPASADWLDRFAAALTLEGDDDAKQE